MSHCGSCMAQRRYVPPSIYATSNPYDYSRGEQEYLQERLNLEISQPSFSSLPFRFNEIAKVILDVYVQLTMTHCIKTNDSQTSASDDLENPDKLRSLLKDLREARQAKSREGIKTLDHSELSVSFPDLGPCNNLHMFTLPSCQIFALWKSMRFDPTLLGP